MRALVIGENTLGHQTHLREIRRFAEVHEPDTVVRALDFAASPGRNLVTRRLESNYSMRMSLSARGTVSEHARLATCALVHTQSAALLLPRSPLPVVVSTDGTPKNFDSFAAGYQHDVSNSAAEHLKWRLVQRAYRRAARVVCFSDWAARSVVDDYRIPVERVHVIPPGCPDPQVVPQPTRGSEDLKVLFVGGDFERKGGASLLSAVADLRHVSLDVVTRSEVPASERVRVHHGVTAGDERFRRLLSQADAMALPTSSDMWSFASIEAMAAGLPVITTAVGGIPEIVPHGECGLLVPAGDVAELRQAIVFVRDHPRERAAMSAAARERWSQRYRAETQYERLFSLLSEVSR